MSAAPPTPINLTEAADRMPWSEVERGLRICARTEGMVLQIQALGHAEHGHRNDGRAETIYIIVSGYGLLRCDVAAFECTAGDVLFMPSGAPHHFERLDGEIRFWRITLAGASTRPDP
jgi:mannose-6-phosphate isomerase-like protein (cupin superfamily)